MSHTNADPKWASRMQSLSWQSPFMTVTEAVGSIHSLRATCLKLGERVVSTKRYTWVTYIRACSCLVNSEHNPMVMIHNGVEYKCFCIQRDMLWCENEHSYVPCDMPWCENECLHVPTQYALACKMYVHICYTIWFGVINDCLHVLHECFGVKMNVCICYMIWFGVQNVCSYMLYDMIWCDKQAVGNICTGANTNPNWQKHNWKCVLEPTLF